MLGWVCFRVAKLLKAFRTLENTPNRRTPSNQVKILIDNIRITSPEFAVIKGHVRITLRSDLHGAISYISREVSELFPDVTVPSRNQGRHRFISETTSSSRPRSFHGLTQENGVYHFYGVDVTDVQRRFSSQEMQTLGPAGQAYVYQERERLRGTNNSGRGFGGRGRGGRGGGAVVGDVVAEAVVDGIMAAAVAVVGAAIGTIGAFQRSKRAVVVVTRLLPTSLTTRHGQLAHRGKARRRQMTEAVPMGGALGQALTDNRGIRERTVVKGDNKGEEGLARSLVGHRDKSEK